MIELKKKALRLESEKPLAVYYDDKVVGNKIPSILSNKIQKRSKEGACIMVRPRWGKFRLQRRYIFLLIGLCFFIALPLARADVIKLRATADIWLSAFNERERNSSSGKVERFKLKSIQEMAAIRFDPRPILGREVLFARLFLHTTQPDNQLRYIRISTVNQDWLEGNNWRSYGPGGGATYNYANHSGCKPWAWPGMRDVHK